MGHPLVPHSDKLECRVQPARPRGSAGVQVLDGTVFGELLVQRRNRHFPTSARRPLRTPLSALGHRRARVHPGCDLSVAVSRPLVPRAHSWRAFSRLLALSLAGLRVAVRFDARGSTMSVQQDFRQRADRAESGAVVGAVGLESRARLHGACVSADLVQLDALFRLGRHVADLRIPGALGHLYDALLALHPPPSNEEVVLYYESNRR
mmetsp:Transcript_86758/g.250625  ORF Transcript_86758/g.250625 Transcript_86758/m.250625 type:complete len:207 (-) Transcript_86758:776-1396(-)